MFYIMSQQSHSIIDIADTRPTLDDLKKLAQETFLDLYVIEGERAGIEYTRPATKLVFGEPIPEEMLKNKEQPPEAFSLWRIDARNALTVVGVPMDGPNETKIALRPNRIVGYDGLVLSPGEMWVTVYRDQKNRWLFFVSGAHNEEEIRVLQGGPDEEKSELVLERVCVLSSFG
jgi:hypothetical protein